MGSGNLHSRCQLTKRGCIKRQESELVLKKEVRSVTFKNRN